jgi:inhibitor of KinA sporulation pathway (predicted exonuclease)
MKELLVSLDLELNQPSRRIIQIGAVVGNIRTGEIVSRFDSKVSPDEELSPAIVKLTKIKQEDVDVAPQLREAYESLKLWLEPFAGERVLNPITWGGGDTETLREQLQLDRERWLFGRRWLDAKTLFVAWRMAQGRELQGGLGRSMTKLGLAFEGRQHNAMDDAENTFRIYRALLFEFGKAPSAMTPAKLLETPARTQSQINR